MLRRTASHVKLTARVHVNPVFCTFLDIKVPGLAHPLAAAPVLTRRPPAPLNPSGPVLVDVPKDIQQQLGVPDWEQEMTISGYISRLPPPPTVQQLQPVVEAIKAAKKPVSEGALRS